MLLLKGSFSGMVVSGRKNVIQYEKVSFMPDPFPPIKDKMW
jgi:hypothetical protein